MVRNIEYLQQRLVDEKCFDPSVSRFDDPSRIVFIPSEKDYLSKHKDDFMVVDQLAAKEFSMNNFGWSRNTISQMSLIQSKDMALAVLKQMQMNVPKYNLEKGYSVDDAFASIRPRSCQMPNELMQFAEHLAKGDMAKLDAAYTAALHKHAKKVDLSKPAPPSIKADAMSFLTDGRPSGTEPNGQLNRIFIRIIIQF